MIDPSYLRNLIDLRDTGLAAAQVTVVAVQGSTPCDAASRMLVTRDDIIAGTVGGGRLEARAIEQARAMIAKGTPDTALVHWQLKQDVGMTCGGAVDLFFELLNVNDWQVVIFGAGHVTAALARLLTSLPCRVTCIDPRADWLARLPESVARICLDNPCEKVADLAESSYVLCMSKGHATDLPVLREIFTLGKRFAYLGVIGSKSKAAVLRRELAQAGLAVADDAFFCPVGLPLGSNHPGEIAVSIAAQMLEFRKPRRSTGESRDD